MYLTTYKEMQQNKNKAEELIKRKYSHLSFPTNRWDIMPLLATRESANVVFP
jgi:hypothetical protein